MTVYDGSPGFGSYGTSESARIRRVRARVRDSIRAGEMAPSAALSMAEMAGCRARVWLMYAPGMTPSRARDALAGVGAEADARVRALGSNQVKALGALADDCARSHLAGSGGGA